LFSGLSVPRKRIDGWTLDFLKDSDEPVTTTDRKIHTSWIPSPTLADRMDDRIQELADGFVRLWDDDTPFTLREGGGSLTEARRFHGDREKAARKRDEESNEPVTRTVSEWCENMTGIDFPFADTVPVDEQRRRANQITQLVTSADIVDRSSSAAGNGLRRTLGTTVLRQGRRQVCKDRLP